MSEYVWVFGLLQTVFLGVGVWIAYNSIRSARESDRRMASLTFMRDCVKIEDIVYVLHVIEDCKDYRRFKLDEKQALESLLEHLEILAIGLNDGIYDRQVVVSVRGECLIMVHEKVKPFIETIPEESRREGDWEEFQKLADSIRNELSIRKGI